MSLQNFSLDQRRGSLELLLDRNSLILSPSMTSHLHHPLKYIDKYTFSTQKSLSEHPEHSVSGH